MNTIAKNYSINLAYQILLIIFPIVLIPYTSRILGPDASGQYAFVYTSSLYFIMIAQMGISLFGAKQISIGRGSLETASNTFWQLVFAKFVSTTFAILLYITFIFIFDRASNILYISQLILLISIAFDISWYYIGTENFKPLLLRNLIIKVISLTFVFIFVKTPNDLYLFALISFSSELIGQLFMWLNMKQRVMKPKWMNFKLKDLILNLKGMFVLFIPQVIIQVYTIMNNTMIGLLSTNNQVAYYDYSTKILNIALTVITSLGIVMLPRIAHLFNEKNDEDIKKLIHQSVKIMTLIGIPIMVSMMVVGDIFVNIYLGEMYTAAGLLLSIYPIKILLVIYSNIMGMQYLVPSGKNRQFIFSVLIGAISSILLNLLLVKRYGAYGVVISLIIAEILVTAAQYFFTRKDLNILQSFLSTSKILISGLCMYIVMLLMKIYGLPKIFILLNMQVYDKIYSGVIAIAISFIVGSIIYLTILKLCRDETMIAINIYIKNKIMRGKRKKA